MILPSPLIINHLSLIIAIVLPENPVMLMSVINTKLRDEYSSRDDLCKSLDIDRASLEARLREAGFEYMPEINQFR